MTAKLLVRRDDVSVFHSTWEELLDALPYRDDGTKVDALIVDAPYSERTHSGHDGGVSSTERLSHFASTAKGRECDRRYAARRAARGEGGRRPLSYASWSASDVAAFVAAWAPLTRGWIVSITDDVLAPAWQQAAEDAGRYAFAPLPWVAPGSRVRLTGDGPSAWTCWVVVARPRTPDFVRWGTLPGAYVQPEGQGGRAGRGDVVGGKPLWLMERLVEDYSRPGDLVCDPCCGAGTTLEAALRTGRRAVGGDQMLAHAELSAARVSRPVQRPLLGAVEETCEATQADLFARVTDEGEAA